MHGFISVALTGLICRMTQVTRVDKSVEVGSEKTRSVAQFHLVDVSVHVDFPLILHFVSQIFMLY